MLYNSTKFDGSIHYKFKAKEIFRNEKSIVLYRSPKEKMKSYRGVFYSPRHMLQTFYKDRYHNVLIMWDTDWTPHMHYINIASPADWDQKEVRYIDLDLDLFRHYSSDEIIIDDEDEFEEHKIKYKYPENLIKTCLEEVNAVKKLLQQREGVFSDKVFDWRPGKKLPFIVT